MHSNLFQIYNTNMIQYRIFIKRNYSVWSFTWVYVLVLSLVSFH